MNPTPQQTEKYDHYLEVRQSKIKCIAFGPFKTIMKFDRENACSYVFSVRDLLILLQAHRTGRKIEYETLLVLPNPGSFRLPEGQSEIEVDLHGYFSANYERKGDFQCRRYVHGRVSSMSIYEDGAFVSFDNRADKGGCYVTDLNCIAGLCWSVYARCEVSLRESGKGFYLDYIKYPDIMELLAKIPKGEFTTCWLQAFAAIRF